MKILVTGGTTFVSKYVAQYYVNKGNDVYVINRGTRKQIDGVTHINCDRLNLGNKLKSLYFDIIIDVTAYTKNHIESLLNSLGGFNDYIFISSSAVYPETNTQPFNEEQATGQNSIWGDYGTNKIEAENYLINKFNKSYILRPPYFYGIYNNLYREAFPFDCAMQNRKFYIPQNGDMKLQFFNVADLCRFIDILIEKHPENHIFNVGNKEKITIKDWVKLCYKLANKDCQIVNVDKKYSQCDYFCFYDYEYYLDVTKQYELMHETIPLEQGLKEEFEWYKNNINSIYNRKPYIDFIKNNIER